MAVAAVPLLALVAYRRAFVPWHRRWGATDDEVHEPLPGDELVAEPASQVTRAITVAASPEDIWPWIVQIGADRGGFYSYDWAENLLGLGIHSADTVVGEWQERHVGDLVYADARGQAGWYVMDVRPNDSLVLKVGDVTLGRPCDRQEGAGWEFSWTFAVREGPDGKCRLLVRERVGFRNGLVRLLMAPVGTVSFVMTRKMLRGVKARAEGQRPSHGHGTRAVRAKHGTRAAPTGDGVARRRLGAR